MEVGANLDLTDPEADLEAVGLAAVSAAEMMRHVQFTAEESAATPRKGLTRQLDACVIDVVGLCPAVRLLHDQARLWQPRLNAACSVHPQTEESTRDLNVARRPAEAFLSALKAMHVKLRALQDAAYRVLFEVLEGKPCDEVGLSSMAVVFDDSTNPVRVALDKGIPTYLPWFRLNRALSDAFGMGALSGWGWTQTSAGPRVAVTGVGVGLDSIEEGLRQTLSLMGLLLEETRRATIARAASVPPFRDPDANWARQLEGLTSIEGLSDGEREAATLALTILREDLGEEFLGHAAEDCHPLWRDYVLGRAPWQKLWLGWFGPALRWAKGCPGGEVFVRDVRVADTDRFEERLSVLRVARALGAVGCAVTFDPTTEVGGRAKKPDLLAAAPEGPLLFVEVSRLVETEPQARHQEQLLALLHEVRDGAYCVRLYGDIDSDVFEAVLADVRAFVARCASQGVADLFTPGALQVVFGPRSVAADAERLANQHGMRLYRVTGPPSQAGVSMRLVGKIRHKLARKRQIPAHEAGLLVLEDRVGLGIIEPVEVIAAELAKGIEPHRNVIGAALRLRWGGYQPEGDLCRQELDGPLMQVVRSMGGCQFERLILRTNDACTHASKSQLVELVQAAFRRPEPVFG